MMNRLIEVNVVRARGAADHPAIGGGGDDDVVARVVEELGGPARIDGVVENFRVGGLQQRRIGRCEKSDGVC